jgi:hypothetical protein
MSLGSYLQPVLGGLLDPHGNLGDYQHAARLFVDNQFALAPKNGWIFYVSFDISQSAIQGSAGGAVGPGQGSGLLGLIKSTIQSVDDWPGRHQRELGMLVKAADLPKFTVENETVNQYNKKTVVQKRITYNPVNLTFHDDMSNVTHRLWVYYYNYYYADGQNPLAGGIQTASLGSRIGKALGGGLGGLIGGALGGAVAKNVGNTTAGYVPNNQYDSNSLVHQPGDYGLNNGQTVPFFNSITLYQLNQQQFTSYTLVNPIITEWQHDKLDVSDGKKVAENKMTIAYETVLYGTGQVSVDNPPGFATVHYDQSPSPLSVLGSVGNALNGTGASNVFGAVTGLQGINPINGGLSAAALLTNKSVLTAASLAVPGIKSLFGAFSGKPGSNGKGVAVPTAPDAATSATNTEVQPKVQGPPAPESTVPDDVSETDLPDPLPTDLDTLYSLQDQQTALASSITDQIVQSTSIQSQFASQLEQAKESGDPEQLSSVYSQMQDAGYTDPSLLQEKLSKVNSNLSTLADAITAASDANKTPDNTGDDGKPSEDEENNDDVQTPPNPDDGLGSINYDEADF